MEVFNQVLKLCAGIGLFLFAMYLLENALKNLSGRRFKLFLQRATKNRVKAVAGGAVVTSILQSSSMVSLMVLAFVGAGVFTLKSALAIILGANLGTTIDSWVVATLGFKTNVEVIAYPMIFAGGLLLILLGKRKSIKYISYFLFGFGLLFIGLGFMKTAMEAEVSAFDFSQYADMPLIFFLGVGFVITLLVQSSSVTMALTLTALHTGVLDFPSAASVVLGSETGTSIKIMLSAIGGTAAKKRVVLGNISFNIVLTLLAFILLKPILILISDVFNISDPLIGLVTFSTLVNLMSVLLFLPFLDLFVKFLERFFKESDSGSSAFIEHATLSEPETAHDLFKLESTYFIYNAMLFNLELLQIESQPFQTNQNFQAINERKKYLTKTLDEKYEFLKSHQGELQLFYLQLRSKLENPENEELNQEVSAVRSAFHAVKGIRNIQNNITDLGHSSKDIKFNFFTKRNKETLEIYRLLFIELAKPGEESNQNLKNIFNKVKTQYSSALTDFYHDSHGASLGGLDMTTVIAFNRELFTSNKAIVMAMKDLLLNEKQAVEFNDITTYLT